MRALSQLGIAWRAAGCAALMSASMPTIAHHSFAMFDSDHQIKLTGTIRQFQWANPHVYIGLDAQERSGATKEYTIECANPGILDRAGWKWNMIKVGDKVTVIIAPLRSGESGGLLKEITLRDGRKFGNGPAAGKANIK
jgi:hypothetical protein